MTTQPPEAEKRLTICDRIQMFVLAEVGLSIAYGISYLIAQDRVMEVGASAIFLGLSIFALLASIFTE